MIDTFTRQQWVEYTCGIAPVNLCIAMDEHCRSCQDCAALSRRMEQVDRELFAAVAVLRESFPGLECSGERAYQLWRWRERYLTEQLEVLTVQ